MCFVSDNTALHIYRNSIMEVLGIQCYNQGPTDTVPILIAAQEFKN